MTDERVTHCRVTATVQASATEVYSVLTDPSRHKDFDGSGMLRDAVTKEQLTKVGQVFQMHMLAEPRGEYVTENHVRTLVPDREVILDDQHGRTHTGGLLVGLRGHPHR